MKYAIEILQTEKFRLGALIRQIEANEHACFSNIPHEEEKARVVELQTAVERLQENKELAATDSQQLNRGAKESRPTVRARRPVQIRKAEIPPCHSCAAYGAKCVQGAFRGSKICAKLRAELFAVA